MSLSAAGTPDERQQITKDRTDMGEKSTTTHRLHDKDTSNTFLVSGQDGSTKKSRIPKWLSAHLNSRDLKTWFKCSIALWIAAIMTYINPVLTTVGTATFFAPIVLLMLPPSGIVFVYILAATTLILGMALGWAWGVITMKAALATRPVAETNALLAQLAAAVQGTISNPSQTTGQSRYTQVLIFDGFMLDTRISITWICMACLFIYFVGRMRMAYPKLTLVSIFSMIVVDIYLVDGVGLPSFQGTIPKAIMEPASIGIGIGVVCNILFFPESISYTALDDAVRVFSPFANLLDAVRTSLEDPAQQFDISTLKASRAQTAAKLTALNASFGFLRIDTSYGRLSGNDILGLKDSVRHVASVFLGMMEFQLRRVEGKAKVEALSRLEESWENTPLKNRSQLIQHSHHQLGPILDMHKQMLPEETKPLMVASRKALYISCEELLSASIKALDATVYALNTFNRRRWFSKPSVQQCDEMRANHESLLEQLRYHKKELATRTSHHLLDPHQHLFDQSGNLIHERNQGSRLQGLVFGMLFENKLQNVADAIEDLLGRVVQLERERTKSRLWLPGLAHVSALALSDSPTPGVRSVVGIAEIPETKKSAKKEKKKLAKEHHGTEELLSNMRIRPSRKRSSAAKVLLAIAHWLSSAEGVYALRMVIVTAALAAPALIRSSAGFYYHNSGVWALIMSQTSMVLYSAEFVQGYVLKVMATILGGILGTVCWYIGAGKGNGNPYGMAAILAPVACCVMYARLYASRTMLAFFMIFGITTFLVVDYSWDDSHIPATSNPGVGYSVAWRRSLLVLIGFTAAMIVLYFPRPPSAARHYSKVLAQCLVRSKDLYALLVATWCKAPSDLRPVAERHTLATSEMLEEAVQGISMLKWEILSDSEYDTVTLGRIAELIMTINDALSELLVASSDPSLPPTLRARFTRTSGVLDEVFIGDVMAVLTMVEHALRTSEPLPAVLPGPMLARLHQRGQKVGGEELNVNAILSDGFGTYCVVLGAFVQMMGAMDELVYVVKGVVGEAQVVVLEGMEEEGVGLMGKGEEYIGEEGRG